MQIHERAFYPQRENVRAGAEDAYQVIGQVLSVVRSLPPGIRSKSYFSHRINSLFYSSRFNGYGLLKTKPRYSQILSKVEYYAFGMASKYGEHARVSESNETVKHSDLTWPIAIMFADPNYDKRSASELVEMTLPDQEMSPEVIVHVLAEGLGSYVMKESTPHLHVGLGGEGAGIRMYEDQETADAFTLDYNTRTHVLDLGLGKVELNTIKQARATLKAMKDLRSSSDWWYMNVPVRGISWLVQKENMKLFERFGLAFPPGRLELPDMDAVLADQVDEQDAMKKWGAYPDEILEAGISAITLSERNIRRYLVEGKMPDVGVMLYPQNEFFRSSLSTNK